MIMTGPVMSAIEITGSTTADNSGAGELARSRCGVAIVYEGRAEGRAALWYARALAGHAGVPLTVLTVASKERTDVGCGSCRQGMAFRNELACEFATAALIEARNLIEATPPPVAVQYVLGQGSFTRAVLTVAEEHGADVVVLPAPRRGRLRHIVSRDRAKMLERRTSASVVVAPASLLTQVAHAAIATSPVARQPTGDRPASSYRAR